MCQAAALETTQGRAPGRPQNSMVESAATEVSLFRQLRLLVTTCVASVGALFWSMILLFMLKVGFALIVCQALQGFILDVNANLETRMEINNLYGSFLKALHLGTLEMEEWHLFFCTVYGGSTSWIFLGSGELISLIGD